MALDIGSGKQGQSGAHDRRAEVRLAAVEPVSVSALERPTDLESTRTQNISRRGARVMTQRIWEPGTQLLIKAMRSDFWAQGRVVYWRSFSNSRYAIGLEFIAQTGAWPSTS
jgi:PilZ domain